MATPKAKTSTSKRNMRRAHDALAIGVAMRCPNCGETKRAHHICLKCGTYDKKRSVVKANA